MKRLIILIFVMFVSIFISYAQNIDSLTNKKAELFLLSRTPSFNEGIAPQLITNFDKVLEEIKDSNINYTHSIHMFCGEIDSSNWAGLTCISRGGGIAMKFIKYHIYKRSDITYIEIIFGNNNW